MASCAYRPARGTTGVVVLMCVLMQVGMVCMVPVIGRGPQPGWKYAAFAIPPVAALIIGWWICRGIHRRREASLIKKLGSLDCKLSMKPAPEEKERLWGLISHLAISLDLKGGAGNIQWLARQDPTAQTAWFFEFQFTTGSGRGTQEHYRTVLAWPAAHPSLPAARLGNLPGFLMLRRRFVERRQPSQPAFQTPAFANIPAHWSLIGNATTGAHFLTAETRTALQHSRRGEAWSLGGGWVCCECSNTLDGDNFEKFLHHAQQVFTLPRSGW